MSDKNYVIIKYGKNTVKTEIKIVKVEVIK